MDVPRGEPCSSQCLFQVHTPFGVERFNQALGRRSAAWPGHRPRVRARLSKFAGGPYEIFYLTVNSNGSIVASWGTTRWGKVTLSGGKGRFDLHTSSGDLYYDEEKQGRVITLRPDFGGWDAQVRPLK